MADGSPDFGIKRAELQRLYADSLAQLANEQRGLFSTWGFTGQIAPEGDLALNIDPNLQYGNVHQLLREHGGQFRRTAAETRQRGLGSTGLAAQRRRLLKFIQGQDLAGFMNAFQGELGKINRGRQGAASDLQSGLAGLDFDRSGFASSSPISVGGGGGGGGGPAEAAAPGPVGSVTGAPIIPDIWTGTFAPPQVRKPQGFAGGGPFAS